MIGLIGAVLAMSLQAEPVDSSWVEVAAPPDVADVEVRAIEVTTDGDVWFTVRDRGLARLRGDSITWVDAEDDLPSAGIADIHEDSRGRLWAVGLDGYGVREGGEWRTSEEIGDLRPRVVFSVHEEPETGAIWLASSEGAGRFVPGELDARTVVGADDGLPHQVVHAVAGDGLGDVWLACRTGLARLSGDDITILFPDLNFRSIVTGSDGTVWFGSSDGVFEWDGISWSRHLRGGTVLPLLAATDGVIWAGTPDGRLFVRDDDWRLVALPDRFRGSEVFAVEEGADGLIWIGTAGGVVRIQPGASGGA